MYEVKNWFSENFKKPGSSRNGVQDSDVECLKMECTMKRFYTF